MDDKYIENIDNLAANVDDLISYLEQAEENRNKTKTNDDVDLASFETVQTEFSTFNRLLQDIKDVNTDTNKTLNAYLQKVDDINITPVEDIEPIENIENVENKPVEDIEPLENVNNVENKPVEDINPLENVNNFDIELETFNNNLSELIDKFENIKTTFQDIGIDYDLNISDENIKEIKDKLNQNLVLDITIDNADQLDSLKQTIEDISQSLDGFSIETNFEFTDWVEDINLIKENLKSISELDFGNINFEILADDNIDEIVEKLESIKNIQTNVDVTADIESIDLLLNKIKEIDLEEIKSIDLDVKVNDIDIDIDKIKESIDSTLEDLNNISYVDIDLKLKDNIEDRLSEIQTELNEFVTELPPLVITSEVSFKTDADQFLEDIESRIGDVDITIKPNLDLSDQIEQLQNKDLDLDIHSNIEIDTSSIEKVLANMPNINTDNSEALEKQDMIIETLQNNNELMGQLVQNITTALNPTKEINTVGGETPVGVVNEDNSVASVKPTDSEEGISEEAKILKQIAEGMSKLIKTNDGLRLEMLKSTFNSKLDI